MSRTYLTISHEPRYWRKVFALLAVLALPGTMPSARALPEDENQPIEINADSSEILFDEGVSVYYGRPARISQGSLVIEGSEIRIEQAEESVSKVVATGSPARFQQQPAVDQGIVYASGETITFDNTARAITIDGNAELVQQDASTTARRIEYDLEANSGRIIGSDDEQIRVILPPPDRE